MDSKILSASKIKRCDDQKGAKAMDWILKYWVEWVFGILGMVLLAWFTYFKGKLKRQKYLEEGVKALLHDRLLETCRFYTKRGWIDYEELHNVQYIYKAYHDLDGNSTGTTAFQDISNLPKQEVKQWPKNRGNV